MKEKCTKQKKKIGLRREKHMTGYKEIMMYVNQYYNSIFRCYVQRVITVFYRKDGKKKEVGKISKNNDEY